MKKRRRLRKGLAMLLSLAMVVGLVPAMPGGANTVKAASGSGTEPSVSAYATKTQLMDGTFAPNADGTAVNIGKLAFGKNSSGNPQEWYILGKDGGVSGGDNNTIIFAASPIATNQVFNSSANYKTYNYGAGTGYGEPAGSTTVNANHYGASDLRVKLQDMAGNTTFFTPAEQGLMNATTVTTKDTKIDNTYTTTDKLYALAADGSGFSYKTIKAGTSGSTVLAMSSYWSSGDWFWLRSPKDGNVSRVLLTVPGTCVNYGFVDSGYAVQPASNLNLSSVLFASAATAASSDIVESDTIASGTAMTLRLNGTGKNIGTVTYYATTGDIKVAKGSTSQTVALVVQGNDGTNDWYYSKKIDAAETVNASAINSALNLSSDIDLSGCKIWLEITDTDGMIYAVGVTEVLSITSVEITGIDTPVSNTALDTEASCVTTGVSSTTPSVKWTPSGSTAGYNTSYTASITLTAGTGYEFTDSTTATVLGNSATSVAKNDDGTLTVTYAFPATAKDKLTSITAPQAITVANGTAYSAMNLPATVNIVTEGNTVTSAPVTWNTTTPASGSYDPAVLTQQTVTLNGTVTCPDSIDANGVSLTTTITITISAAGIVGAPTANPTAGTYSKNQSVKLTSSTEGATIYYTTDGSEPTITGGVLGGTTAEYTAPIAVTGTEGQSVTTTIKAIAVKNGMQDSSVETFTYTIHQIPVAKYTYATKTQLMDGTFAPITDGTAVNIGKLVFGKNNSGNPQEWYILGKDESVSGDNTIIFAANPIKKQVFEDDRKNNKTESSLWSDCDYSGVRITEVCPNHYGASDLRVALKSMATNISYFTTAEQGLMNATTVTTYDKNNRVTYTTTDNLYALQGDYQKDKLWAGTSDSTVLARSSYWSNGSQFWLRSPYGRDDISALLAIPGDYVRDLDVDCYHAVQPASNLNLSSVLFASSAKAASSDTAEAGPIAEGTAMTLRLNGTGKNIGTVTYNTTTGDIKAVKGSTSQTVALVVQGNDGTNDWYYSKKIDAAETVNASDIKSALKLSSDIDLSACKIWLEITDSTENLTYAFSATAKDKLTSITAPQAITVANGTAYDAMNLPATVNIVTEGNTVTSAPVTWDTTTPASGNYDPAVLTEQTVTLNGEVTCPDSIDANGVSLTTTITITISAAGIVGAPTANPTAGTYSKNQSVELTSSTEGATIYYTTDGSEPTITGGAPSGTTQQYIAPIAVTGTEGQSVETTIKAIAVKNGMQDSSVETFTYTIQIPVKYTYATKTQLMDGTFAPNADGTTVNIGKLVFGKNNSGEAQEWYILGKDNGVSGDNTIIFAASPIATNQVFEDDYSNNKVFQSSFGVYASNPSEVYPNHYGASDLRVALQGMATNTSYFTTAEHGLMNATTVTTNDTKNSVTYTTTDKLYALAADGYGSSYHTIKAGSGDSTVLAMNSYWSSGYRFWLRLPYAAYNGSNALLAYPGYCVDGGGVSIDGAVRPASNLNLSSVLFASAATAASSDTVSGTLTDGTAMTLRFDGTGKNIGTVTYNTTTDDIKATKGSTEGDVALVVQGNDETNNWYFSKQITGTEIVKVSDIVAESNTPSSIDLSTCKIWLEITDTDGLIYAVGADKKIEKINTTYVTKVQLMNSFTPNSDGTAVNYGKIVFGKKSDGTTAQEWYILGKDNGVSGDNTIIFASSPIATGQVFNSDTSDKTYDSTTVNANHYGASYLRVALQNMATNTSYFTTAEQGLMNPTTVTTNNTKNSINYTTTDKLYALAADGYGSTTIKAGTNNQTVLAMSKYWSRGDWFWLRSPYGNNVNFALLAFPGRYVDNDYVSFANAVQPASNLNLSSVLFASAAQAASSDTVSNTIASETAMTLRFDGTGKDIGTVSYNATTGDIKVAKGSTEGDVALVVQGNDGTNDWYYSKKIDEEETVNASDIKSALSLTSDIDLSDCKIWLEITDTDGMIYAIGAAAIPDAPHIEHVDSNNDNICDSCGKYMDNIGARLAGHSLTLDGSVGVNFYMELSSEVISDSSAYMEFTLPGGKTSTVNVSDANTEVISGKTYYKFRCQVNAAEMTDTIKAQLKSTVGNSKVYEYTVKEYADYLFAHKEDNAEFAKAANLIEAMVNYGSYAQIYAGYNAENLAVGDAGNLKSVDDVTIGEYTYTPNANETKVQFAGANLSLLSTTTLRMYFKITDVDVANVTFTYGENTLEKTQSGDYYYVELVGIPASKLDDDCVVTVNDGTNSFDVTYTPMAYCANVVNRETTQTRTESLKNLMRALVVYNQAADAYIGNTNNGNQ